MKYGSNIPEARRRLAELALRMHDAGADEWRSEIADIISSCMYQTPPDKIAPIRINSPTAEQRRQVLVLRCNTDMSQKEIAELVGLNPGRVSEIIHDRGEPFELPLQDE